MFTKYFMHLWPVLALELLLLRPSASETIEALIESEGRIGPYKVLRPIAAGAHSRVYEVVRSDAPEGTQTLALKVLLDERTREIDHLEREVRLLRYLKGGPNVIQLHDVLRHPSSAAPLLVLELAKGSSEAKKWMMDMTDHDVRWYMFQLLRALNHTHTMGIMHRDIKHKNIMVDPIEKRLRLVDFGIAQFVDLVKDEKPWYGTRPFTPPEVFIGNADDVGPPSDCWAAGVFLAGMMFNTDKMIFPDGGKNSIMMLLTQAEILGTDNLDMYLGKIGLRFHTSNPALVTLLEKGLPSKPWTDFVTPKNQHLVSPEALDLLSRLLRYDPDERLTARAALFHPYFKAYHRHHIYV